MRGKKPYNIRNIEAHITNTSNKNSNEIPFTLNKKMVFQNNTTNNLINTNINQAQLQNEPNEIRQLNEFVNAQYGVSKYASNLVSGKMFKKF